MMESFILSQNQLIVKLKGKGIENFFARPLGVGQRDRGVVERQYGNLKLGIRRWA